MRQFSQWKWGLEQVCQAGRTLIREWVMDGPEGSWTSPERPWGSGTSCSWILITPLAYHLHTPYLHYSLAAPCLFLQIAVFPAQFNSSTLYVWLCPCSWKLLAARQCRAPVCLWLEASSSQMLSCFLESYLLLTLPSAIAAASFCHGWTSTGTQREAGNGQRGGKGRRTLVDSWGYALSQLWKYIGEILLFWPHCWKILSHLWKVLTRLFLGRSAGWKTTEFGGKYKAKGISPSSPGNMSLHWAPFDVGPISQTPNPCLLCGEVWAAESPSLVKTN